MARALSLARWRLTHDQVHSSLEAVGLTAAVAAALTEHEIRCAAASASTFCAAGRGLRALSCCGLEQLTDILQSANVIAGHKHDHILVPEREVDRALDALIALRDAARARAAA